MENSDQNNVAQIRHVKPTEEEIRTIKKIGMETMVVSVASIYVAHNLTGRFIASSNIPPLKRWATVLKLGSAFMMLSIAPRFYFRTFCVPRIKKLPRSEFVDLYTNRDNNMTREERHQFIKNLNTELLGPRHRQPPPYPTSDATEVGYVAPPTDTDRQDHPPPRGPPCNKFRQNKGYIPKPAEDPEHIDQSSHLTDKNNQYDRFDDTRGSHQTVANNEFDYSRSNTAPPVENEVPTYDYSKQQPKIVRRNKYGDIIEEDV